MSIDCKTTIPAPARVHDVANVIGILLGCKSTIKPLGKDGIHCVVDGVKTTGIPEMPHCCNIEIETPTGPRYFLYHYEWDELGNHGIMPRARASNIALCVAIADFFGGVVDFNDCDDTSEDYRQPVREDIHVTDGQPWDAFQRRMGAVQPITRDDIAKYAHVAAYEE